MDDVGVLLIIFNRPDLTSRVFERIRAVRPKRLFVAADGPRATHPGDVAACESAREVIQVDWECEVHRDYSDKNLGCGIRPSSAISWALKHVSKVIILEDDCLPDPTYFSFCEELLKRFENDTRVYSISGASYEKPREDWGASYRFSLYHHSGAWATWRRAWADYDFEMSDWPKFRDEGKLSDILRTRKEVGFWRRKFEQAFQGKRKDAWDYQWTYATWKNNGLHILPAYNLISNIGFTESATHTQEKSSLAEVPLTPVPFPLVHPLFMLADRKEDSRKDRTFFSKTWLHEIARSLLRR